LYASFPWYGPNPINDYPDPPLEEKKARELGMNKKQLPGIEFSNQKQKH